MVLVDCETSLRTTGVVDHLLLVATKLLQLHSRFSIKKEIIEEEIIDEEMKINEEDEDDNIGWIDEISEMLEYYSP